MWKNTESNDNFAREALNHSAPQQLGQFALGGLMNSARGNNGDKETITEVAGSSAFRSGGGNRIVLYDAAPCPKETMDLIVRRALPTDKVDIPTQCAPHKPHKQRQYGLKSRLRFCGSDKSTHG